MSRPNVTDPGRLIAHRGASQIAPENTLGAFRAAHSQGAHWIEFDVSLLGDGTAIAHHDATFDRCTNRTGPLCAYARNDLPNILTAHGEPVPTLEEALDLIETLGFFANLELKPHDRPAGEQAAIVARALRERTWAQQRIICSSFRGSELVALRRLLPDAPLAILHHAPPPDWLAGAMAISAAALHLRHDHLEQAVIDTARGYGLDVRVFTVNDPGIVVPFRKSGLTGIITDHPPLFLEAADWQCWLKS